MIHLFKPFVDKGCFKDLKKVLRSGYIGEGKKVKEFERLLSDYFNGYVVLVNSCTAALHLAYHMIGVNEKTVVSTPMTCMATNTPILQNGGKIVWADVDPLTGNITAETVKAKISKKTGAVVGVHYGGNLFDREVVDLCEAHGVPLVEDCAHLLGVGYGNYQCYSFQAIKFLTTGDGGCLVTRDKKIYDRAKLLRWYGIDRESGQTMRCMNPVHEAGYKFHMNDISATIGISNFKHIEKISKKTQTHANYYNRMFSDLKSVTVIPVRHYNDYWLYILHVRNRGAFQMFMKERGIETSLVHARNDTQPIFKESLNGKLEGLEEFWESQVCIPVGWWLSDRDIANVAGAVEDYDEICAN